MVREMSDAYRPKVESLITRVEIEGVPDEHDRFKVVQDLTFTGVGIAYRRTEPVYRSVVIGAWINAALFALVLWPGRRPSTTHASPS